MPIVYDKLLALKIPEVEQSYGPKDCMLYALGVGLGLDPMDEDELAFVYEKNLKALPTMAVVIGYPGFWVKELDTGIDWVKVVAGEHALTLHRPLRPSGTVRQPHARGRDRRQGRRQGRDRLFRAHDRRQGDRRAHRHHRADHVLPRRRRLRRPAARAAPGASDPRARARPRLRPADAARDGADLSAQRRSQSAARRSRGRQGGGLSAPDPARARDLRRRRPRDPEEPVRLRSGAAHGDRRPLLGAGVSGRDHPHRDCGATGRS